MGAGATSRRKWRGGFVEERRIEEFSSPMRRARLQPFSQKAVCLIRDMLCCVLRCFFFPRFFSSLWLSDSMLLDFTATIKGVWQRETAKYRLCTIFVTSVPPLLSL